MIAARLTAGAQRYPARVLEGQIAAGTAASMASVN
jgi:hypothetical protein